MLLCERSTYSEFDFVSFMQPTPLSVAGGPVLPQLPFYSVEYPGYVQHSSVPLAINNLGGQSKIDHAFKRTPSKTQTLLELSLRPGNPFAHPIPGDVVDTNNLLLKVTKRKRKHVDDDSSTIGEYTTEVVGVVSKTARFRSDSCSFFSLASIKGSIQIWSTTNISLTWMTQSRSYVWQWIIWMVRVYTFHLLSI